MTKINFNSVNEYIASQTEAVKGVLERVRSTIRKALPRTEEVISYQMPTYKLHGSPVLYFAGWKKHYSLYPATINSSRRSRTTLHHMRLKRERSASHSTGRDR